MALIKNVSPVKKFLFLILAICIGHITGVMLFYFYAWGGSGFFQHMSFSPSRFRFMWSFFNVHPTARMLFHGLLAKGRPGLIELTRRIGCFGFFYVFFKFFPVFVWALLFVTKKEDEDKDDDVIQGRWATEKELRKSDNLFDWNPNKLPDIIMAQTKDAKLKWINSGTTGYYSTLHRGSGLIGANQGTNVFTFGGTGDGKGIGTILPTLLANQNSVIVYDPKGENFEKSAGWRQSFSRVLFFDPTDPKCTCHFNPLDWISKDSINILRDIKDMTAIICPMDKANSDPFWVRKGRQIIEFLICYVLLYREKERQNLYEVANVIYNFSSDLNKVKDENQKMIELLQKKQSEEQDEAIQQKLQAEIDKENQNQESLLERMLEKEYSLGGEQTGHIIIKKDCNFGDGLKTALCLINALAYFKQDIIEATSDLKIYPQLLVNVKVKDKNVVLEDKDITNKIEQIRSILSNNGQILVRASGTEPLIRVMVEAENDELCNKYVSAVTDLIKSKGYEM